MICNEVFFRMDGQLFTLLHKMDMHMSSRYLLNFKYQLMLLVMYGCKLLGYL